MIKETYAKVTIRKRHQTENNQKENGISDTCEIKRVKRKGPFSNCKWLEFHPSWLVSIEVGGIPTMWSEIQPALMEKKF